MDLGFNEEWSNVMATEEIDFDKVKTMIAQGCTTELVMRILL